MYLSNTCSSSCCHDDHQFSSNSSMSMYMYSSSFLNPNSYRTSSNTGTTADKYDGYLQRSNSSHSLPIYHNPTTGTTTSVFASSSPSSSSCRDFMDFNSIPVRRVFSTGDLQGMNMNGCQVLAENSAQEANGNGTLPIPSKIVRYSAEERKERIDKYRSKRNQRNFQKKITYACRKTLADSRPRVKGRFARNGEPEIEAENGTEISAGGNNYGFSNHGSYNAFDSSGNEINIDGGQGDLWRQIEQAMEADDEGIAYFYDEEMWNSLSDVVPNYQ